MINHIAPKVLPLSPFENPLSHPNGVVEEGLLRKIFEVLPPVHNYCVEFGAGDGRNFLLTRHLIEAQGWSALLIEGDPAQSQAMKEHYKEHPRVTALQSFITAENIEDLFAQANVPEEFDFLSIDLDGNDYHIWKALRRYRPRVVCVEFNASYGPTKPFVIDYDPEFIWQRDDYFGASISSFLYLAQDKGYVPFHSVAGGGNAFFIDRSLVKYFDYSLRLPHDMYQPPQYGRYGRALNGKGHPASRRNTSAGERLFYRLRYHAMTVPRRLADLYCMTTRGRRLKTYNSSDKRLF